jgi:hypothetical protein
MKKAVGLALTSFSSNGAGGRPITVYPPAVGVLEATWGNR